MESRTISNGQITASSFFRGLEALEGRLNNNDYWATATALYATDPWIQVDLLRITIVTGIITQGSGNLFEDRVTHLQIKYGDEEDKLVYILDSGEPKVSISTRLKVNSITNFKPISVKLPDMYCFSTHLCNQCHRQILIKS